MTNMNEIPQEESEPRDFSAEIKDFFKNPAIKNFRITMEDGTSISANSMEQLQDEFKQYKENKN